MTRAVMKMMANYKIVMTLNKVHICNVQDAVNGPNLSTKSCSFVLESFAYAYLVDALVISFAHAYLGDELVTLSLTVIL